MLNARHAELIGEAFETLLTEEDQRLLTMHNRRLKCPEIAAITGLSEEYIFKSLQRSYLSISAYAQREERFRCILDSAHIEGRFVGPIIQFYARHMASWYYRTRRVNYRLRMMRKVWFKRCRTYIQGNASSTSTRKVN